MNNNVTYYVLSIDDAVMICTGDNLPLNTLFKVLGKCDSLEDVSKILT